MPRTDRSAVWFGGHLRPRTKAKLGTRLRYVFTPTPTHMKPEIHPKYYDKAVVRCACGNRFTIGATKEKITVEICSKCHPFYTGEEKLIDTAGRVEKFKTRRSKAQPPKSKKVRIKR